MASFGQIFSATTQAIFYNWKPNPVQRMLDFDFLCGVRRRSRHASFALPTPPVIQYRTLTCGGNPLPADHFPSDFHALQDDQRHQWPARCSRALPAAFRRCSSAAKRSPSQSSAGMRTAAMLLCSSALITQHPPRPDDDCAAHVSLRCPFGPADECSVLRSIVDAVKAHPKADVFINFASMRRCALMPVGGCVLHCTLCVRAC